MTEESAIELISLVKQFPLLYDRSHPLYNNSAAKSNAWKEVAKGCKLKETDELECQSRWKALRDKYSKQKKKMIENENFKPSSSKVAEFIDQMSFLSNMIVHKSATRPRKPKSDISQKRKLNIRERIIKTSKPNILSHKRKPVPVITEQKVPELPPKEVVTPVANAAPVAGTSQDDKYVAIQSIQLLPSLPISQWPQLNDENVQYIKIHAEANNRNQPNNWNDNSDDIVDYRIAITDCMGPNDITDSDGQRSKMTANGCAMMQPLNDVRMEEICSPEVEIKSEKQAPAKRDQFGVVNAFWNIVKERAEQEFENSEDHLFAIHLSECLSRFPPRKRNLVKGEILMLMSKFDYEELN